MTTEGRGTLRRFRTRLASGLLVLVPLVVTIVVLRFVFTTTASILLPFIDPAVEDWPWLWRAALSIGILVVSVYLLGELATNIAGRRLLEMGESVVLRVPFVKVIYSASKQVAAAFQGSHSKAFKSVVMVEFPRKDMHALGFLTSTFTRDDGSRLSSVFVPTTPNPTTGFLQVLPEKDVVRTGLTVEELPSPGSIRIIDT
jgi:uncharacterized membrane protein